eukprot:scaffold25.g5110.t1
MDRGGGTPFRTLAQIAVAFIFVSGAVAQNMTTSCGSKTSKDACAAAADCTWLAAAGTVVPPTLNDTEVARIVSSLRLPTGFDLFSAAAACGGLALAPGAACPAACAAYFGGLPDGTVGALVKAVCALQTCTAAGACFESANDFGFKRVFLSLLLQPCLPAGAPSLASACWTAGGACIPGAAVAVAASPAPAPSPTPADASCAARSASFVGCMLGDANCSWTSYCSTSYTQASCGDCLSGRVSAAWMSEWLGGWGGGADIGAPQCYIHHSADVCRNTSGCAWQEYSGEGGNELPFPMPPANESAWQPAGPLAAYLSPAIASQLLSLGASSLVCGTAGGLLEALSSGADRPCMAAGLCTATNPDLPRLQALMSLLAPGGLAATLSPCTGCHLLLEGEIGELNASAPLVPGLGEELLPLNISRGAFAQACSPLLQGLLEAAARPGALPLDLASELLSLLSQLDGPGFICSLLGSAESDRECASLLGAEVDVLSAAATGNPEALATCPARLVEAVVAALGLGEQAPSGWGWGGASLGNASEAWWEDPDRSGHGMRDLITPPVAARMLSAQLQNSVCEVVSSVLRAAAQGPSFDLCESVGACTPSSPFYQILSAMGLDTVAVSPCEVCLGALPDLQPAVAVLELLGPNTNLTTSVESACPGAVAGFLKLLTSTSPDIPAWQIADVACPAFQARRPAAAAASAPFCMGSDGSCTCPHVADACACVLTACVMPAPAGPHRPAPARAGRPTGTYSVETQAVASQASAALVKLNATQLCQAARGCPTSNASADSCPCVHVLGGLLAAVAYDPNTAGPRCYEYVTSFPASSARRRLLGDLAGFNATSNATYSSPNATAYYPPPPTGYCYNASPLPGAAPLPQCYQHSTAADCSASQGCNWSQGCYDVHPCSPNDAWCRRTQTGTAVCKPLLRALFSGSAPAPAALPSAPALCAQLGACAAAGDASATCQTCVERVGQMLSSLQGQRLSPQPWALQSCADAVGSIAEALGQCAAVAAAVPPKFASPAAMCAAHSDLLCGDRQASQSGMGSCGAVPCPVLCSGGAAVRLQVALPGPNVVMCLQYRPHHPSLRPTITAVACACAFPSPWQESYANTNATRDCSTCEGFLFIWQARGATGDGGTPGGRGAAQHVRREATGASGRPAALLLPCIHLARMRTCPAAHQDLVSVGLYPSTAAGVKDYCFAASLAGSPEALGSQLNWKVGCVPSPDNSCCRALPATSFLRRQLGLAGLQPSPEACAATPGCMAYTTCRPAWGADACSQFTESGGRAACEASTSCRWVPTPGYYYSGQPLGGFCYDALMNSRKECQQAGLKGGAAACATLTDASGAPLCSASQQCLVDWSLACNPEETNQSDVEPVCDLTQQCISKYTCYAYTSERECSGVPNCVWRVDRRNPVTGFPPFCMSTKDACGDYTDDPDACASNPACKARSRAHQCWDLGAAACNSNTTDSCQWYGDDASGFCSPEADLCWPNTDPLSCAATKNDAGDAVCRYSAGCADRCRTCRDCVSTVEGFQGTLAALGSQTGLYADAARARCTGAGGDWFTCYQVQSVVQRQPVLAKRPAALCKAIGHDDCVARLDLDLCAGAATSLALGPTACRSASNCPAGASPPQDCSAVYDSSCSTHQTYCDETTGADVVTCIGTCRDRCALLAPSLARLNGQRCASDIDCADYAGNLTCQPVAGRTCKWAVCDNGTVTQQTCTGWCLPVPSDSGAHSGPQLESAQLSDDGRSITLQFDQAITLASWAPSAMFDTGEEGEAERARGLFGELRVLLGLPSTVSVGGGIGVLPSGSAIVSAITGLAAAGTAELLAPDNPVAPSIVLTGPAALSPACNGSARSLVLDVSGSPYSAGRSLSGFAWTVAHAAGAQAALAQRASMPAGNYAFTLTAANWLGAQGSATFSFAKQPGTLPDVSVLGGTEQEFAIASGIRLSAYVDLSSVCPGKPSTCAASRAPGKAMSYQWTETSGLLSTSFVADRQTLAIRGPVAGLTDGQALAFTLNASLTGLGSVIVPVSLTARASPVAAVLRGPRGDVLGSAALVWDATSSLDPDDLSNLTPFRRALGRVGHFTWDCSAYDSSTQQASLCFSGAMPAVGGRLTVPGGTFTPGLAYTVSVTATKGSRSDADTATISVLSTGGATPPTGTITRFCPGGACPKKHSPSEPLRLLYALDDPSLASDTTYAWTSPDVSLAGTRTDRANLVVQPFRTDGSAVLPDGARLAFTLTATAGGRTASSSLAVDVARRPACAAAPPASCLVAAPVSGECTTTAFVLTASDFAADEGLVYDWGRVTSSGGRDYWARGGQLATYTFATGALPAGQQALFVCARGTTTGASACANVTVNATEPATPAPITQQAVTSLADRQLASAASAAVDPSSTTDASVLEAVAQQTAGAIAGLAGVASSAAQAVISAATQALSIAGDAAATLSASGASLAAEDLGPLVNVAGNAAGAATGTATAAAGGAAGSARRLFQSNGTGQVDSAAALQALTSAASIASHAQSLVLASQASVAGERAATMGTGASLVTTVATLETATAGNTSVSLGGTAARLAFPAGFAPNCSSPGGAARACPTDLQLRLSYSTDPSLLLSVVSASSASVPLTAAAAAVRRGLLAAGPQPAMCLRLDDSGFWRSDGIALAGVAGAGPPVATCALFNLNNNQARVGAGQILVVNYELAQASPSPSPSPSPAPGAPPPSPSPAAVSLPAVAFSAHLTGYAAPADFGSAARAAYTAALTAAVTEVDARVLITDVRAGSVYVDTQTAPASIFPASTFGAVAISGASLGTSSIVIDPSLLSAPALKRSSRRGATIGGAVGGGLGGLLLMGVTVWLVRRRAGRPRRPSAAVETPRSPTSPTAFISSSQPKSHAG